MTTEKRPRNSKELPLGTAVEKLTELKGHMQYVAKIKADAATQNVHLRFSEKFDAIFRRLPREVWEIAAVKSGVGLSPQLAKELSDADHVSAALSDAPPDSEPLTPADLAAIEEGRAAIQRGEGLTTTEVREELDVADEALPKGAREYVPGPAARNAARGR